MTEKLPLCLNGAHSQVLIKELYEVLACPSLRARTVFEELRGFLSYIFLGFVP